MPDHLIHLRRAWEADECGTLRRIDLPIAWPAATALATLSRRFHAPRTDPATERVLLRFESVPGLISASLNGRDLGRVPEGQAAWEVTLADHLQPNNRLVLVVGPPPDPTDEEWGRIALVIRPSGSSA